MSLRIKMGYRRPPRSSMDYCLRLSLHLFFLHWLFRFNEVIFALAGKPEQLQLRVYKKIDSFIQAPIQALEIFASYYNTNSFPNSLLSPDRELALDYIKPIQDFLQDTNIKIYYALEDGTVLGYWHSSYNFIPDLVYREPGISGFSVDEKNGGGIMEQYWDVCVNDGTGASERCLLQENDLYVSCIDDCDLIECQGSSTTNTNMFDEKIYCKNYEIKTFSGSEQLGYVPASFHCIDKDYLISEEAGKILVESSEGFRIDGSCTFKNGDPVQRKDITGPYGYCINEPNGVCSATYMGAYTTFNYDARFRGWYIASREALVPVFADPYIYVFGTIGMTYTYPIFDNTEKAKGKTVFAGVLAADFELEDVRRFLIHNFGESQVDVAIYEDKEPHKLIATSTPNTPSFVYRILSDDGVKRDCTQEEIDARLCQAEQLTIQDLENYSIADTVLQKAHLAFEERVDLNDDNSYVVIDADDENLYRVSVFLYEVQSKNLKWRILISMPLEAALGDDELDGDSGFLPSSILWIYLSVVILSTYII